MSTVVEEWLSLVDEYRGEFPAEIVLALIERVSGGDAGRIGPAGGRGLMQIHPNTAAKLGISADELLNPDTNVSTGVRLLQQRAEQLLDVAPDLATSPADLEALTVGAYFFGPALILRELEDLGGPATADVVLERPGLERIDLFVGDVIQRAESIALEVEQGIAREDEPIGGPGEAPTGTGEPPSVTEQKDRRALWWVLGLGSLAVAGVLLFRRK